MGDIADMMIEGVLCEECGGYIEDEDAPGHPRKCEGCSGGGRIKRHKHNLGKQHKNKRGSRIACPQCPGRFFQSWAALEQHRRASHVTPQQTTGVTSQPTDLCTDRVENLAQPVVSERRNTPVSPVPHVGCDGSDS